MRHGVLVGGGQLREGDPIRLVGHEHRVVAEPVRPAAAPRRSSLRPCPRQRPRRRRATPPRPPCETGPGGPPDPAHRRAPGSAWRRCRHSWPPRRRSGPSTPRARRRGRRPRARCHRRWPAGRWPPPAPRALSRALSSSVSPVSSTSGTSARARKRRIEVAEDLADLPGLVRIGRGQDEGVTNERRAGWPAARPGGRAGRRCRARPG